MTYYWECPQSGCRINSPDIPQEWMNRRYGSGVVTEKDVNTAYDEYDDAIEAHVCQTDSCE